MLHSFTVVDYDWHAIGISKGEALRRGQDAATAANQFRGAFIPKNNAITGLKWYGGDVFVTVPRWLPGVPSTLNKVIVNETCDGGTCTNVSLLQPYPMPIYNSTEPSKIKYVQSMEIDYENVMWILDVGRLNIADPATSTEGAAKLVLWDMEKNKQKGEEYEFPASVAPHNSTFLNDLMVDVPNQIAYISDAGSGAIVVVDMRRRVSVRFHGASTKRDPAYKYVVEGWDYGNGTATTPADGIALTPDRQWLYWCPCQGQQLYKVQTIYLQRAQTVQRRWHGLCGKWHSLQRRQRRPGERSLGVGSGQQQQHPGQGQHRPRAVGGHVRLRRRRAPSLDRQQLAGVLQ